MRNDLAFDPTACCEAMKEHLSDKDRDVAGGILGFKDGTYAVAGCCGGGCYVLADIRHCPFCGAKLQPQSK